MKKLSKKVIRLLLAVMLVMMMPCVNKTVSAESKPIEVGTEYYMGDTIEFGDEVSRINNNNGSAPMVQNDYVVDEAFYSDGTWIVNLENGGGHLSLWFYSSDYNGKETVIGIRCTGGNGSAANPYSFDMLYQYLPEKIDDVSLDIYPPEAGDSTRNIPTADVPSDGQYTVIEVDGWRDREGNYYPTGEQESFKEGDVVVIRVQLYPADGFEFAEEMTIDVEGADETSVESRVSYCLCTAVFTVKGGQQDPDPTPGPGPGPEPEPEPEPEPAPTPTPAPAPTPAPVETDVSMPKTGVEGFQTSALIRYFSLMSICVAGAVVLAGRKK